MWIDDFFNLFMKNLKVIWNFKNKGLIKYNQWNNTKLIPNKKSTKDSVWLLRNVDCSKLNRK